MKNQIIKILNNINIGCDYTVSTNFIEDGLLDSMDLIELVAQLETVFQIKLDWMQLEPKDFMSIDTIISYIERNNSNV